jgi:hypothetical protein
MGAMQAAYSAQRGTVMPALQTTLHGMNKAFGPEQINETRSTQNHKFAPGQPLHTALADQGAEPGTELHRFLREHLRKMPAAMAESVRAAVHAALNTEPPTHIAFAWAPGYDWEATIWQAPDTAETKGGVTILIKSRYPADGHPLS